LSFDIIVLKPRSEGTLIESLDVLGDVEFLGRRDNIKNQIEVAFGQISWDSSNHGICINPEGFSLEILIPETPEPESLQLSLFFGSEVAWEHVGSVSFHKMMMKAYELFSWQFFAVSDNSSMLIDIKKE
jgi:hypothetical protein